MTPWLSRTAIAFLVGAVSGAVLVVLIATPRWNIVREVRAQQAAAKQPPSLQSLAAEIETLKDRVPDQAHAMADVGYHYTNLWFAAQKEHWELANFYLLETRSHLRWAVRIIPKRKDKAGQEIDLQALLQAFENSAWKQMQDAIAAKDKTVFEKKYRFGLESCYACHKAADKPFIRPQIPTQPEAHIINFDAKAKWPP